MSRGRHAVGAPQPCVLPTSRFAADREPVEACSLGRPLGRSAREGFGNTPLVRSCYMEAAQVTEPQPLLTCPGSERSHTRPYSQPDVRAVPVAELRVGYSPRHAVLDEGHVASLMEVADRLPPVIVNQGTMAVIDGVHRVEVFRRLGRSHIKAVLFAGDEVEALATAIEANVKHGKPLSRSERQTAAQVLLKSFPERSDRWVGDVCGLSHTTVAVLRGRLNIANIPVRTGRDGRQRPVDPRPGQMALARVMADHPSASLRQAAGAAGVAPSTAQRAVARLRRQEIPSLAPLSPGTSKPGSDDFQLKLPVYQASGGPSEADSWLATTEVTIEDLRTHLRDVPLSRVYEVADECRRRAKAWAEIAVALEARARQRPIDN
jgi:ParB-like chromosome segregation protein Spo0J